MKKFAKYLTMALIPVLAVAFIAYAGLRDRSSDVGFEPAPSNYIYGPEISASPGAPTGSNWRVYVVADVPYFISDGQVATSMIAAASATAWSSIGDAAADSTITFDDNEITTLSFADVNEDMMNVRGVGAFGDVSVLRVDQITGNPTDGTVLEVVAADANVDPLVVSASGKANALVVGQNTGVVTIAGVAEGTTALGVALGDILITDGDIHVDAGDALFDEDVTVAGWLNLTGDLVGGTGLINYTNFDVDAAGNVAAVGGAFSGSVSVTGTFQQDALSAASAATTITVDGTGTGGVGIGTVAGSGAITLGGSATAVTLPATVDLTLSGGDLTITDTANTDTVAVTNNTMTTADLFELTTGGTRLSGNVIKIIDSATTADAISVTANALTTGTLLYLDSDRFEIGGPAGFYIECYDGDSTDFSIGDEGATIIDGVAATDVLTINAGDIQMTTGDIGVDDGIIVVANDANEGNKISRNDATGAAAVLEIEETHATGGINLLLDTKNATAAEYNLDMTSAGATHIHLTANGAAGDGVLLDHTASYTGQGIKSNLGAWLGTAGEGYVDISSSSGAVNEVGQAIRVNLQGTGTAGVAVEGKAFHAESQAAIKAGESLVYLDTLTNTALHIDNEGVAADGVKFDVANAYTGQGVVADLGPWLGTTNEGFIDILTDNAASVAAGEFIRLRNQGTGQHAAAIDGTMVYMEDDAVAPAAGTSYGLYMDMTNIEAIHVDAGKVLVDETVTATAGVSAGNAADSFLHTDTVALSNAEIKALAATPKALIAAPGATNYVEVLSAVIVMNYGTNVFTVNAADDLMIQYNTTGVDITASIETTGFLDQAVDQASFVPAAGIATVPLASVVNRAVELFNTGVEIAGNAGADTLITVKITYRIHDDGV